MDTKRVARVSELLRHEISRLISTEIKDPLVQMATVSKVKLTDDLKYARVFISVIGDEKTQMNTMKGLDRAKNFVRNELGHRTELRFIPEIQFEYDDSAEYAMNIEALLKRTKS